MFAAVRAARLGANVVIIEKQNAFGGVATSGLMNIWHSLQNMEFTKQIIAGLTLEMSERLQRIGAVIDATGDGDLCDRLGMGQRLSPDFQPSTTCAKISGWSEGLKVF